MEKFYFLFFVVFAAVFGQAVENGNLSPASYAEQIQEKLSDPLLHQKLINADNYAKVVKIAENYKKRNSLNPGWLNIFRTWNSGETLQNRTALENKRNANLLVFDMDKGRPLDWSKVTIDKDNNTNLSDAHFALSLDTSNIADPNSPILLLLLSNQHVINDYLSNNAAAELRKRGYIIAVMEYPGYGVSLGLANKNNWITAIQESVNYLNQLSNKKVYLVGHSIGGPLALEAAATSKINKQIAGVVSYGGFSNLIEQAKDQDENPILRASATKLARILANKNNIDGLSAIDKLISSQTPSLILHGKYDGPVPARHAYIYADKISKYSAPSITVKVLDNFAHEEINNFTPGLEKSEADFNQLWDIINDFFKWK